MAGTLISGGISIVLAQTSINFPDVAQDAYYASAVANMTGLGVITGYENGNFGPNDAITRGQATVMFDRYDATMKLLVDDYCNTHKLQMGMMATKYYQDLCINRGYSAYEVGTQQSL